VRKNKYFLNTFTGGFLAVGWIVGLDIRPPLKACPKPHISIPPARPSLFFRKRSDLVQIYKKKHTNL
jgi:hypothetical protein